MFKRTLLRASIAALSLTGCASLSVTRINSDQDKPNNVWVFFTVEDDEEPVAGLAAEDFEIYEDGELVSPYESQQTIQNPEVAAVMYTLLLLDMSGSVTESGQADALVNAAQSFVDKVEESQSVGVYTFEGGESLGTAVPFTERKASVEGGLEGLRTYKAKDPSTNLNGAVEKGLEQLRKSLDADKRPLKFGTLVVFTDGTDRAGRVTAEQLGETLDDEQFADFEIYAIGVGAELQESNLRDIGRDGTELATDEAALGEAFERVADRIAAQSRRFYLLSYCTPARSGEHTVRIDALQKREDGKTKNKGSLEYSFSAEGFGPPPACDPERKPTFRLDKHLGTPTEE